MYLLLSLCNTCTPTRLWTPRLDILLPSGFSTTASPLTGQAENNATLYYTNSLQKGQVFQVETFLNLASNVSLGDYSFPTTILWSAILTNSTSAPEVSLEQFTSVRIGVQGVTKLSYTSSQSALTPGQVNNITLTLINSGSGNASNVQTTISSSNSGEISVLNQFPQAGTLAAQQSTAANIDLFVSSSGCRFVGFSYHYYDVPRCLQQSRDHESDARIVCLYDELDVPACD